MKRAGGLLAAALGAGTLRWHAGVEYVVRPPSAFQRFSSPYLGGQHQLERRRSRGQQNRRSAKAYTFRK